MKKITVMLVLAAGLLAAGTAVGQHKSGYISVDQMVLLMPETSKIDSLLGLFEKDSLNPQLNYIVGEYQRKDTMFKDPKTPASVKKTLEAELQNLVYQIQNWDNIKQQVLQNKQEQLLRPIYDKAFKAIQDVAKEKGYTYVHTKESLLVAPPGDDILPFVAEKLKVKLPPPSAGVKPGGTKTNN